ncbi:MAG: hypothetical protein ABIT01_08150 [Thermoanaerobaculia bacterium]
MNCSPLIREVFRRAKERGWSDEVLAARLHVDRTTLSHIRSGRKLQTDVMSRIVLLFAEDTAIHDLVLSYLLVTVPAMNGGDADGAPAKKLEAGLASQLGADSARAVAGYVRSFRIAALTGEGRFVEGESARALSAAIEYAALLAERYDVGTLRLRAASALTPSLAEAALRIPLLLVERVEFASPSVTDLLAYRAAAAKAVLATSALPISELTDERLRRTLLAATRRITLAHGSRALSPAAPPFPTHADAT